MILLKTQAGQQVFKDRSVRLTPRQRSAFILFDGKRSIGDVLAAGMSIVQQDIDQMVELGLLEVVGIADTARQRARAQRPDAPAPTEVIPATEAPVIEVSAHAQAPVTRSAQQRYQDAYPVATRLTAALGLRGFRLNLAVEAASNYEQLAALAPKIRAAVGDHKAEALEYALGG